MLLCVDIGNSHTVSGLFSGPDLLYLWRLKSDPDATADEIAIQYHSLFQLAGGNIKKVTGVIVASVVPALETTWLMYCNNYLQRQLTSIPLAVSRKIDTGIAVITENPDEVGADRIVNAVAAWERFKSHIIVIDFGTAITLDCVGCQREYLGGAILPGIGISLDALATRTAKLPRIDMKNPLTSVIGTNTVTAIQAGTLYGFGGMVDRVTEKLSNEFSPNDEPVNIIATGGMAEIISPYSRVIDCVDPLLTLKGLQIIHQRITGHG